MAKKEVKKDKDSKEEKTLAGSLDTLSKKLNKASYIRDGEIVLHLSGKSGAEYRLHTDKRKTTIIKGRAGVSESVKPSLEIWCDAARMKTILDGKKDPVKQFLAGKMRVRGDIHYLSELGEEIGILQKRL